MKTRTLLTTLVMAFAALLVKPQNSQAQERSTSISYKNGIQHVTVKKNGNRLDVEFDGRIEFSDDDRSIESMSRFAHMRIRSSSFGQKRELIAEPDGDGSISYDYYEGRKRADFDNEGKKWLGDVLLEVIRSTGIGLEARVDRFYESGGIDAIIKEVGEIDSDYVSHLYFKDVMSKQLTQPELAKLAAFMPKDLNSDHYISEVFSKALTRDDESTRAFILNAMGKMRSDHYISLILKKALRRDSNGEFIQEVLERVEDMRSDHYKAQIMSYVLDADLEKKDIMSALKAIKSVRSDHYKSQMLKDGCFLVNRSDDEVKSYFREVARGIRSDHYYGQVTRCVN